jgi:hypothetical protein
MKLPPLKLYGKCGKTLADLRFIKHADAPLPLSFQALQKQVHYIDSADSIIYHCA